jgi:hypothetical protein
VTVASVRLADELELIRHMFDAKEVPCRLLGLIGRDRERQFHQQGWAAVVQAVRGEIQTFDYYFDFVCSCVADLEALWKMDAPLR